jgi:hypothetical protein
METCGAASEGTGKKLSPLSKASRKKKSFVLENMRIFYMYCTKKREMYRSICQAD